MSFLGKLASLSKAFVILGIVLYLFGFITLSAYLAQFGIISFDILNSRFIIAGLFSFLSMSIALLFAWALHKRIAFKYILHSTDRTDRFLAYFEVLTEIYLVSYVFCSLFNLGRYAALDPSSYYIFHPFFGKHDFVGNYIAGVKIAGECAPYLKIVLYLLVYVWILLLAFYPVKWLFIFLTRKKEGQSKSKVKNTAEISKDETESLPVKKESEFFNLILNYLEVFFIAIYVYIYFCSFHKLVISRFDFASFAQSFELKQDLIFSWFYTTVIGTLLFVKLAPKLISKFVLKFDDFDIIHRIKDAFQFAIIPVITGLLVFGYTIFPRIPFTIGGGEPRQINIKVHNSLSSDPKDQFFLLGESEKYIFVVRNGELGAHAYQINKADVEYIETKSMSRKTKEKATFWRIFNPF